jgi:hypothetical protein
MLIRPDITSRLTCDSSRLAPLDQRPSLWPFDQRALARRRFLVRLFLIVLATVPSGHMIRPIGQ